MPLIHVSVPKDTLNQGQKDQLIDRLSREVLKVEGALETPEALALCWIFLDEIEQGGWGIAGTIKGVAGSVKFLVQVTVPQGSLDDNRRQLMAETVNKVLSDLNPSGGPLSPQRAWCVINEVPDGNLGAGGHIFRLADIARAAGVDPNSPRMMELVAATR